MSVFTLARNLLELKTKERSMKYLICLFILFSSSAYAGSIHKWVDEDGNTHYGDAPPASTTTKELKVDTVPSDPGKALPRLGTSDSGSATTGANNSGSTNSGSKVPDDQAKAACEQAQGDLKIIQSSSRVRLKNPDGTSRYMTTEEIKSRQQKAEEDVKSFCK
jgi:hypothetical protein